MLLPKSVLEIKTSALRSNVLGSAIYSPIFLYKDLGTQLLTETVAELCSLKKV